MKRTSAAALAVTAFIGWISPAPAHAVPPTVTPSPGYDARLQEQRAASRAVREPEFKPVPPRRKKPRAH